MKYKELPTVTVRDVRTLYEHFKNDPTLPATDEEVDMVLKMRPGKTDPKSLVFPRNIKDANRITTAYWSAGSGKWIKSFVFFSVVNEKQEVDPNSVIPTKVK